MSSCAPSLIFAPPHIAAAFAPLLVAPFQLHVMDEMPSAVCGLWPDLRIGYVNPAWLSFGRDNGRGELSSHAELGANILDAIPAVLRPFYVEVFARALATRDAIEHDYECSSLTQRRTFRMRVHPTAGAVIVVHSLLREEAHGEEAHAAVERIYRDERGMIEQCAHCRRIRRASTPDGTTAAWDWVPDYVAKMPPSTSHGICAVCIDYFYPEPTAP